MSSSNKRGASVYLNDILECIARIEEYTQGKTEADFVADPMLQDAIIRRIEIVGEAINNISEEFTEENPEIPWRAIVAMRNIIVHEYFGVMIERIWDVIHRDLPQLKEQIRAIMPTGVGK